MARQQPVLLQNEFGETYGTQHQPAPVTPVHGPEGGEESEKEQRRRAASRERGPPVQGGRNEGFPAGSVFGASVPRRNSGEGDGDEFGSQVETDGSERRNMGTDAEMRRADPGHLEEICCREDKKERGRV